MSDYKMPSWVDSEKRHSPLTYERSEILDWSNFTRKTFESQYLWDVLRPIYSRLMEEFELVHACAGNVIDIFVPVNNENSIHIYTAKYGEYKHRPGPWWNKINSYIDQLILAEKEARIQMEIEEKNLLRAKKQAEDDLYGEYIRRSKLKVFD